MTPLLYKEAQEDEYHHVDLQGAIKDVFPLLWVGD